MADSPDETDSMGEPTDDGQLTIRIPNPKVYMARQSLWIGRRGKPRCDHCRMNNLKCDRVLPACNHCSWAAGRECKYTPLPTPAHRGIPRCDRCRLKNLKCDRNLPVCNHCGEEDETECNYTPKKRHKVPTDHALVNDQEQNYGTKSASFLISDMAAQDGSAENMGGHTFYGQNIASTSSRNYGESLSPTSYHREGSSEPEVPPYPQTGRFTAEYQSGARVRNSSLPLLAPKPPHAANQLSFISHSFPPDQGMVTSNMHIEPWSHPSFPALPEIVLRLLDVVNSVEMPSRNAFDDALATFLSSLMPELQETACLMPDIYAAVARCLSKGDMSKLSARIHAWTSCHHLCSGSDKYNLILIPRDSIFQITQEEERLRKDYRARIDDGKVSAGDNVRFPNHPPRKTTAEHDVNAFEWTKAFERLPVQTQIYDILAYAHRAHESPFAMLSEVRRLGIASITWPMTEIFIRLCPLCNLRSKPGGFLVKAEPSPSSLVSVGCNTEHDVYSESIGYD